MAVRQLKHIALRDENVVKRHADIEREITSAIADLLYDHDFAPVNAGIPAPYNLVLGLEDHRLVMELRAEGREEMERITLGIQPLRSVIKSYFMVCESYYAAVKSSPGPSKIETLDAGRRGIHNEGAQLLREMLQDKVALDHCTARRLFTLVAALHLGGWANR
ncbi:MAG: UPF0262 family protein [Alphaproteobacteria bacterium]